MSPQVALVCESLVAQATLERFGLVGVTLSPLFAAPHLSLLVGVPLDVVLQAHWVSKKSLAGGAVEKSPVLVFG